MPTHSTVAGALEDLLTKQFQAHIDDLLDMLYNLADELSNRGQTRMIEILEAAVTPTGAARAARGGHPGRVETGTMRDAITSDVDSDGDEIIAKWGWLEEVQAYFLLQEHGDSVFGVQFEGMKALMGSYIEMREELRSRLKGGL